MGLDRFVPLFEEFGQVRIPDEVHRKNEQVAECRIGLENVGPIHENHAGKDGDHQRHKGD